MIGPEITYRFQQLKDTAGGTIDHITREQNNTQNLTIILTAGFLVPNDKFLIVSVAQVRALPGAGQIAEVALFTHETESSPGTMTMVRSPEVENATADLEVNANFQGEMWVPPGERIQGGGVFNSGVNANLVEFRFSGILIPRGNIQQT